MCVGWLYGGVLKKLEMGEKLYKSWYCYIVENVGKVNF